MMLQKSPNEVRKLILNQIKIGRAIRSQRLDYVEDLEEARAEKQEWVSRTIDLLKKLFEDSAVVEQCNDWVGPILPEYAEWEMFVEQFDKEMQHRIGRLQEIVQRIEVVPETPEAVPPAPADVAPPTLHKPVSRRLPMVFLFTGQMDENARKPIREFLASLDLVAHELDVAPSSSDGWQLSLARQLKGAGVAIDLNRLI
jgi:hypothetical protein